MFPGAGVSGAVELGAGLEVGVGELVAEGGGVKVGEDVAAGMTAVPVGGMGVAVASGVRTSTAVGGETIVLTSIAVACPEGAAGVCGSGVRA